MDNECYAILTYFNGSWIYNALHDINDKLQHAIVDAYIADYSQEELDEIVYHVEDDYSLFTVPGRRA